MFKKELIISALVVFFSFGLVGAAFAENTDPSVLGADEFSFDAQPSTSELSAQNAAMNYQYDQDRLVRSGTEAGTWEHSYDDSTSASSNAIVDKDTMNKPVCSNC